jgi:hypothetical protein
LTIQPCLFNSSYGKELTGNAGIGKGHRVASTMSGVKEQAGKCGGKDIAGKSGRIGKQEKLQQRSCNICFICPNLTIQPCLFNSSYGKELTGNAGGKDIAGKSGVKDMAGKCGGKDIAGKSGRIGKQEKLQQRSCNICFICPNLTIQPCLFNSSYGKELTGNAGGKDIAGKSGVKDIAGKDIAGKSRASLAGSEGRKH